MNAAWRKGGREGMVRIIMEVILKMY